MHKVGRNEPCPCGSGKKYKRCCGSTSTVKETQPIDTQNKRVTNPVSQTLVNDQFTANVKDYFETDYFSRAFRNSKLMCSDFTFNINIKGQSSGHTWDVTVHQKLNYDYEANAIYSYLYVSDLEPGIDII